MAARLGGAGGYLHWRKYSERKEPMPCAIVVGCAPVVMFTGPQKLAIDQDEMAVAGGLAGAPIRIAKAVTVDLDVPADAEIVIEGLIDPELLEPEGPFGESHGHVALEDFNMSMQVTAITRKRAPVFVSIVSQVTPSESSVIKKVAYEPMFLTHLRDSLVDQRHPPRGDARAADQPAQGDLPAIRARHRRTAKSGAASTAPRRCSADCGKICIAVSEDIDPAQRRRDLLVARLPRRTRPTTCMWCPTAPAATARNPGRGSEDSTLADRRHAQACDAAAGAAGARIHGARARASGRNSACPPLTPQPPWHGYSLGDWAEAWDAYRAARGRRRLGRERPRDFRAPPRRRDAGNAGARGGNRQEVAGGEFTVLRS